MTIPAGTDCPLALATRSLPSADAAVAKSMIIGSLPFGIPAAKGFVPNILATPPYAATAGSALHHIIAKSPSFVSDSMYSPRRPM